MLVSLLLNLTWFDLKKYISEGWSEELGKMDLDMLRNHPLVKIPKDLTDRSE